MVNERSPLKQMPPRRQPSQKEDHRGGDSRQPTFKAQKHREPAKAFTAKGRKGRPGISSAGKKRRLISSFVNNLDAPLLEHFGAFSSELLAASVNQAV